MIPIAKSWEWADSSEACRVRSANLCIILLGLCQIANGIVAVLTLGFIITQLDIAFMFWNITPKEAK